MSIVKDVNVDGVSYDLWDDAALHDEIDASFIEALIANPLFKGAILNIYYPVGSFYETSDSSFDPNNEFGGTWVLEEAGRVHVSSGTGYAIGTKAGATTAAVPTTKLTDAQIAHGHSHTFKLPNHVHKMTHNHQYSVAKDCKSASGTADKWTNHAAGSVSGTLSTLNYTGNTDNPTSLPSISGSVSNLSGASSTRTAHGHGSVSTMQPYIVVNRWYRTA